MTGCAGFAVAVAEGSFAPLLCLGQFTPEDISGPMKGRARAD